MAVEPSVTVGSSKREILESAIRRAGEHLEGLREPSPSRASHHARYPYSEETQLAPWLEAKIVDLEESLRAHERAASDGPRRRTRGSRRA
jgi:hypothetical protein